MDSITQPEVNEDMKEKREIKVLFGLKRIVQRYVLLHHELKEMRVYRDKPDVTNPKTIFNYASFKRLHVDSRAHENSPKS